MTMMLGHLSIYGCVPASFVIDCREAIQRYKRVRANTRSERKDQRGIVETGGIALCWKSDPRSVQLTGGGHSSSQRKTKIGKEEKCMSCRISPSAATERTRTGDNNRLCFESGRSIEHVRVSSGIGCLHIRAMKLLQVHKLGETTEADIPSITTSEVKESCRQHYTLFNVRPANGKCRAPKLTQKN